MEAVTSMVSVATGAIVSKILASLQEQLKLHNGLEEDLAFLARELQMIQSILSDGDHRAMDREILKQLKGLSYDIEDCVDLYVLDVLDPQADKGIIGRVKKRNMHTKVGKEIQAIKSRLMDLSRVMMERQRISGFTSRSTSCSSGSSTHPPVAMLKSSILVGVDGPRDEVAKILIEEEPESARRLKVVSIVGSGGLGKTTLAKEVYSTTKPYFDCCAWVSASVSRNMEDIFMGILSQVDNQYCSRGECEGDLIRRIKNTLQHKRYLLVLDDIWRTETWEIIKSALPLNNSGSRVITTTRINSVAASCCSHWNDHIYNIKPLSKKDSRILFHGRIFGSVDGCPQALEEVSDKILKKCSGLPLAIIVMSGLLATKPRERSIWESLYYSIGAAPECMEGMESIFLRSYYDLPHHLRVCFLYLSIFPEDYSVNHDRIIRSWIAEGFVLVNRERTLEEVGESYLNELINRNMIQPVHGSYDGKTNAFRIHGLMLDLIKSKSIEENFVYLLGNGEPVSVLHSKIRRLSIINVKEDHCIPESVTTSPLRSLHVFGSSWPKLSFKNLRLLRVLELERCVDLNSQVIKEIAGLLNLRYLGIRDTPISKLPRQIGKLKYLITLDLQGSGVRELPMSVLQLQRLAHLLCDPIKFPKWIGSMSRLSCLSQFDILQSEILAVKELGNLSELKELVLWWIPDTETNNTQRYEYLDSSLCRLDKLESLYIQSDDSSVDFLDYLHHPVRGIHSIQVNRSCYLNRIPEWFISLPCLANLCVVMKEVKNESLKLLSMLSSLRHLSLSSKAMPTEKLVIGSNGFPDLREFHLHFVRLDLTFEPQAMKRLEKLLLSFNVLPEETYGFSVRIEQFRFLKTLDIRINGKGADASQFEAADFATVRKAAVNHPNRPIVNIITTGNLIDSALKGFKEKDL